MAEEALLVLTTFPDIDCARRVVQTLVEEYLIACGNIIPGVESIYRWRGAVEANNEVMAILKTEVAQYQTLEVRLTQLHPYEVPECLAIPVSEGWPAYLRWLTKSLIAPEVVD